MSNSADSARQSRAFLETAGVVFQKTGHILGLIASWIYRLRKILLSIPVIYLAIVLALKNLTNLPDRVGLNLQASGIFAQTISKGLAVVGPLGITAACLLLMLCSRKVLYPWIISLFSLVLPILILFMNTYPA